MKKLLTLGLFAASLLASNAFAQSKGEADPDQSKGPAVKMTTPAEKAAAKQARKEEGRKAAKMANEEGPQSAGNAKVPKSERQAAAVTRKAAAADAVKKGQTTSGEK